MPTQLQCTYCAPPGSGYCKDCQATESNRSTRCGSCYGCGRCRHCYGTGFERTTTEKAKDIVLSIWWISWFGLIGGFLWVGVWEYRIAQSIGSGVSHFCLALLIVTILLWAFFFVLDSKARGGFDTQKNWRALDTQKDWQALVLLSTLAGTILAIYTTAGILFFIYIAPRVH